MHAYSTLPRGASEPGSREARPSLSYGNTPTWHILPRDRWTAASAAQHASDSHFPQMSFFKSRKGAKSSSMRSLNSSILDASTGSFTTNPQLQQPPIKIALGDSNLVFEDGAWSIGSYRVETASLVFMPSAKLMQVLSALYPATQRSSRRKTHGFASRTTRCKPRSTYSSTGYATPLSTQSSSSLKIPTQTKQRT